MKIHYNKWGTVVFHLTMVIIIVWTGDDKGNIVILSHMLLFHDRVCTAYLYVYIMLSMFIVNKDRVVIRSVSC
jgi:hypothetical protein